MAALPTLRNIGERSAKWLQAVGISSTEELVEVGVVEAYMRAKAAFPDQVTLNLLYALQGALLDLHWTDLPRAMRADLRKQVGE